MKAVDLRDIHDAGANSIYARAQFSERMDQIVRAASVRRPSARHHTAVPCDRAVGRRRCRGRVVVRLRGPRIDWSCSRCDARGALVGWRGGKEDLRRGPRRVSRAIRVSLPRDVFETMLQRWKIGERCPRLVASAVPDGPRVRLRGEPSEVLALCEEVTHEVRHSIEYPKEAVRRRLERALLALDDAFCRQAGDAWNAAHIAPKSLEGFASLAGLVEARQDRRFDLHLAILEDRPAVAVRLEAVARATGFRTTIVPRLAGTTPTIARARPHFVLVRAAFAGGRGERAARIVSCADSEAWSAFYVDDDQVFTRPKLRARRAHAVVRESDLGPYLAFFARTLAHALAERRMDFAEKQPMPMPDRERLANAGAMLGLDGKALRAMMIEQRIVDAPPPALVPGIPCHDARDLISGGYPVAGPEGPLARKVCVVVQAATIRQSGRWWVTPVECRKRKGPRVCRGWLETRWTDVPGALEWRCPACGDAACIAYWDVTAWNRVGEPAPKRPNVSVRLTREEIREAVGDCPVEVSRMLLAAVPDGDSLTLSGLRSELGPIEKWLRVFAADPRSPSHERTVRAVLSKLRTARSVARPEARREVRMATEHRDRRAP